VVTAPKSYSSIRVIPLPDFILNKIRPFIGKPNSYILSGTGTDIVEPRTMQNRFKTYLKQAEITEVNFHTLRHTFATRCVEVGFDIKTLSEILGHSSVKITLDKYVHSSMPLKRSSMEKLCHYQ
jgi:integrase